MREDIVYLTLYLVTEMMNYLLAYRVIFQAEITRDKRRWAAGIVSLLVIHFFIMVMYGEKTSESVSAVTMIMLPLCMLQKKEKKNFIIYPFIVIGTSNIMISVSFLCAVLFEVSEFNIIENDIIRLFCQCMPIIMMFGLDMYRRHKKKKLIYIQLGRQQYILFYIGIVCTYFMISALQVLSKENASKSVINVCGLAISFACIVFIFLILWQGIVVYREIQYKERCEMNEQYLELQAEHYRQLMAQDEKMRKFRHDMNSHINMLKYYCESQQYPVLNNYLSNMVRESAVYDVAVYTRNRSVDAVIAPLAQMAQEKNIKITWNGILPEQTKVALYDLCTIMSNLLKNAVEACDEVPEENERKIEVKVGSYNNQIFLTIRNTVAKKVIVENQNLITSKKDRDNHGIGSQNVKEAVEKYDGTILYLCENGWFEVKIGI
ncbi:MAG: GHKL domain-containing protein [Lachnospiraceae bacterium]|nr:GHKL domain-containing protein [Lachnospiraceae bacterium]